MAEYATIRSGGTVENRATSLRQISIVAMPTTSLKEKLIVEILVFALRTTMFPGVCPVAATVRRHRATFPGKRLTRFEGR